MTREESKKYIRSMLTGRHPTATHNHYGDVATAIDVIYDSLQSESKELYFKRMTYLIFDGWEVSKKSLYDEEGVEGWLWNKNYEREYAEIGDWDELPTMPEIIEEIADKLIAKRENNGN